MRLSAVFAVARCLSVCLSVRPSVTLVYCVHTTQDSIILLSLLFFLFFFASAGTKFQVEPYTGAAEYTGGENLRFSTKVSISLGKQYGIGPWLQWNVNRSDP